MLLRLSGLNATDKATITLAVLHEHMEKIPDAFTVIFKDYVKIRYT